ncbi:macrolide ABC transporter ATP-binding protein [Candidatus Woesebacteria bacterium CG_4_10_14_0_2_um_filter_39_14]|uniref:Macrolide ABC transporter ATP-binding protein n=1 Tax=Candidatus Woesebacteria bacterium CG_4_10_14_0_2_um_filter_39_14 TaxID=1975054 RepID=A0A2M7TKI5_9BACT|nr:MAG: macrolide ABC transporter ATP-binding protein [Candidatus Woesebacteria bacterium CG_4_10_14_0_2_um_filter_39_14]
MLLELKDVSKIFQLDGVEVKALQNISFEVKRGEFLAIMGPSGSGKSTLMYLMGCLDSPTSGKISLEGKDISGLSEQELAKIRNKKIGFVFQMFNLLPRTSALANVELPLIYSGLTKKEREIKARQALSYLGLKERLTHFPSQLSGGEQQRVAIARALVTSPAMILADEPTGNVDSQSAREIMKIFKELNKEGNTIVVVTHDKQVAKYAKKIIKIHDGRIV